MGYIGCNREREERGTRDTVLERGKKGVQMLDYSEVKREYRGWIRDR
jgi:hypothetical protein